MVPVTCTGMDTHTLMKGPGRDDVALNQEYFDSGSQVSSKHLDGRRQKLQYELKNRRSRETKTNNQQYRAIYA